MHTTTELVSKYNEILKILNYDGNQNAMLVGGCVRDFLKDGVFSNDIDISTILKPHIVIDLFQKYKKLHHDTIILDRDKKYGTVIVIINNQKYEITTTRKDIMCFGRKAEVEFCEDFKQDSERRDFTINALYLNINGEIVDFHQGLTDLSNNCIKFIGNIEDRIQEDYLRIIRFYRFATKYNFSEFDDITINAIIQNKKGLLKLSRERIRNEIWKMLEYKNWFIGLKNLEKFQLLEEVFLVKKNIKTASNDKNFTVSNRQTELDKIVKLFYFFDFDINILIGFCDTLKFTSTEKKFVLFLKKNIFFFHSNTLDKDAKYILFNTPELFLMEITKIVNNDLRTKILAFNNKKKPLPLSSKDLMTLGYSGKQLGNKIIELTKIWIETDFSYTKEQLLQFISK